MEYIGKNFSFEEPTSQAGEEREREEDLVTGKRVALVGEQPCKFLVGVFDRTTSSLSVYPAENTVHMYQHVKSFDVSAAGESQIDSANYKQSQAHLVDMFGSKKRRRDMYAKDAQDISRLSDKDIKGADEMVNLLEAKSAAAAEMKEGLLKSPLDAQLPPYNPDAKEAEKVFDLSRVLTSAVQDAIDPKAVMKASKSPSSLEKLRAKSPKSCISTTDMSRYLPACVLDAISGHLHSLPDKKERKRKAFVLLYLAYMVRFYGFVRQRQEGRDDRAVVVYKQSDENAAFSSLGLPQPVVQSLLANFCEKRITQKDTLYTTSKITLEKLLNYILVFCLCGSGFTINGLTVAADLRMPLKKLQNHFRAVGCVMSGRGRTAAAAEDGAPPPPSSSAYTLRTPFVPHVPRKRDVRK